MVDQPEIGDRFRPDEMAGDPRLAPNTADGLHELGAAFEDHDREEVVRAARHLPTDLATDLFGPTSFFPVFLLSLLTVFAVPLAASRGLLRIVALVAGTAMVWTALSRARIQSRLRHLLRTMVIITFLGAAVANFLAGANLNAGMIKVLSIVDSVMFGVILLVTTVLALLELLHHESFSISSVAAAMAAYLMIGLFFATAFGGAAAAQDGEFFAQPAEATPAQVTYFSFITLTTVGYGDLSATTPIGRALVVAEAITGQIFLVTIVARVVSAYGTRREGFRVTAHEPTPTERRAQRRAERRDRRSTGGDA